MQAFKDKSELWRHFNVPLRGRGNGLLSFMAKKGETKRIESGKRKDILAAASIYQ